MMEQNPQSGRLAAPLLAATAVAVAAAGLGILGVIGFNEDGVRLVLRTCARTSFMLFLLVFLAGPLAILMPGRFSHGLVRNRASLGLAFAISHFTMGAAILTYHGLYRTSFYEVTYPLQRIGGALGFAAIAVMVVTTFEGPKRWLGPKRWRQVHTLGLYFLFINFLVSFGRRTLLNRDTFYLPFLLLLLAALGVRLVSQMKVRLANRHAVG